ncbi:hypothetical protein BGZ79_002475, partial [Entomortierella chlamydospora]
ANQEQILNHEFEALAESFEKWEHYKGKCFRNECFIIGGLFVLDAYIVKVAPRKPSQYAQNHNNMVQKQQPELAVERSLQGAN